MMCSCCYSQFWLDFTLKNIEVLHLLFSFLQCNLFWFSTYFFDNITLCTNLQNVTLSNMSHLVYISLFGDNALRLLILVAGILCWGLQVTSSYSIWSCVLKGFWKRYILKGIEDCNLEHWSLGFHAPTKESLQYKCQSPKD